MASKLVVTPARDPTCGVACVGDALLVSGLLDMANILAVDEIADAASISRKRKRQRRVIATRKVVQLAWAAYDSARGFPRRADQYTEAALASHLARRGLCLVQVEFSEPLGVDEGVSVIASPSRYYGGAIWTAYHKCEPIWMVLSHLGTLEVPCGEKMNPAEAVRFHTTASPCLLLVVANIQTADGRDRSHILNRFRERTLFILRTGRVCLLVCERPFLCLALFRYAKMWAARFDAPFAIMFPRAVDCFKGATLLGQPQEEAAFAADCAEGLFDLPKRVVERINPKSPPKPEANPKQNLNPCLDQPPKFGPALIVCNRPAAEDARRALPLESVDTVAFDLQDVADCFFASEAEIAAFTAQATFTAKLSNFENKK